MIFLHFARKYNWKCHRLVFAGGTFYQSLSTSYASCYWVSAICPDSIWYESHNKSVGLSWETLLISNVKAASHICVKDLSKNDAVKRHPNIKARKTCQSPTTDIDKFHKWSYSKLTVWISHEMSWFETRLKGLYWKEFLNKFICH